MSYAPGRTLNIRSWEGKHGRDGEAGSAQRECMKMRMRCLFILEEDRHVKFDVLNYLITPLA